MKKIFLYFLFLIENNISALKKMLINNNKLLINKFFNNPINSYSNKNNNYYISINNQLKQEQFLLNQKTYNKNKIKHYYDTDVFDDTIKLKKINNQNYIIDKFDDEINPFNELLNSIAVDKIVKSLKLSSNDIDKTIINNQYQLMIQHILKYKKNFIKNITSIIDKYYLYKNEYLGNPDFMLENDKDKENELLNNKDFENLQFINDKNLDNLFFKIINNLSKKILSSFYQFILIICTDFRQPLYSVSLFNFWDVRSYIIIILLINFIEKVCNRFLSEEKCQKIKDLLRYWITGDIVSGNFEQKIFNNIHNKINKSDFLNEKEKDKILYLLQNKLLILNNIKERIEIYEKFKRLKDLEEFTELFIEELDLNKEKKEKAQEILKKYINANDIFKRIFLNYENTTLASNNMSYMSIPEEIKYINIYYRYILEQDVKLQTEKYKKILKKSHQNDILKIKKNNYMLYLRSINRFNLI